VVDAHIIEHPSDKTVPIETNATFHCNGTQRAVWIINQGGGSHYTTDRARDLQLLRRIGFFPESDSDGRLRLTVLGTVANNNTNIVCRVFVNGISEFSSVAKLKVLGGSTSYAVLLKQSIRRVCMPPAFIDLSP